MGIKESAATKIALSEARVRHPHWGIWISNAGRYWATRRGNLQINEDAHPGWAMTIDADSLGELEERISAQEDLSSTAGLALHNAPLGETAIQK